MPWRSVTILPVGAGEHVVVAWDATLPLTHEAWMRVDVADGTAVDLVDGRPHTTLGSGELRVVGARALPAEPPGWNPDPAGCDRLRRWDGHTRTDATVAHRATSEVQ